MSIRVAERNRQIKRVLAAKYGRANVSVTAGKGTAYGWVHVDLAIAPETVEAATSLRDEVVALIKGANIELNHHYGDGPEADKRESIIVKSRRDKITAAAVAQREGWPELKPAGRHDFCEPDCTCRVRHGEVMCVKLLPAVHDWNGKRINTQSPGELVDALNKLWLGKVATNGGHHGTKTAET